MNPFVLGIMGDSGSGKNTVADAVAALIGEQRISEVQLDDYHRFTREERAAKGITALNPIVQNLPLMQEHLQLIRRGRPIRNRRYDHTDGSFGPIRVIPAKDVVLVRGLVGYPNDVLRQLYDLAVFLNPEPELLFRWKLRRDVRFRGYTEAEVLKHIAQHLLDAKQFVLPQAERADLVIRYQLPDWEAPDSEVKVSLLLRRLSAEVARNAPILEGLTCVTPRDEGDDLILEFDTAPQEDQVRPWIQRSFPETWQTPGLGRYHDEVGDGQFSPQLALIEGLVARLAIEQMSAGSEAVSV